MSSKIALVGLVAITAGFLAWVASDDRGKHAATEGTDARLRTESEQGSQQSSTGEGRSSTDDPEPSQDSREAVATSNLHVPIGVTAQPIVVHHARLPQDLWGSHSEGTKATVDGASYAFSRPVGSGVITATCAGCRPVVAIAEGPELPTLVFQRVEAAMVFLVAPDGAPSSGSLTVSTRTDQGWWHRHLDQRDDQAGFLVDPSTKLHLMRGQAPGLEASVPWRGFLEPGSEIHLTVAPTFSAHGRVRPAAEGSCHVVARRHGTVGGEHSWGTAVDKQGQWRLNHLPWEQGVEYVFRLEAEGGCVEEHRILIERPGGEVTLDFELSSGLPLQVTVLCDGEPVEGADVTPSWRLDTESFDGLGAVTDVNGQAQLHRVRRGAIAVRAEKDGYGTVVVGPLDLFDEPSSPVEIEVEKSGRIRGQVTHAGDPVEIFEVRGWDEAGNSITEAFVSDSGEFVVDSLTPGVVHITAKSPHSALIKPVKFDLSPDRETEVHLELGSEVTVRGVVIDSATGMPLSGVRVEGGLVTHNSIIHSYTGSPVRTDGRGEFQGVVIPEDYGVLALEADGYSQAREAVPQGIGNDGEIDLGMIAVAPRQDVTVTLLSVEGYDLSPYLVAVTGNESYGPLGVDSNGQAVFRGVDSGPAHISVSYPGSRIDQITRLVPGELWNYSIPVATGCEVSIEVQPAEGEELPAVLWLMGAFRSAEGETYSAYAHVQDGKASLDVAGGSHAALELVTGDGEMLLAKSVQLSGGSNHFRWQLTHQSDYRLISSSGEPHSGLAIDVGVPGDPVAYSRRLYSGANGEFRLGSVGDGDVSLYIRSPTEMSREIIVQPPQGKAEVREVVVDFDAHLQVSLVENSQPAAGIALSLAARAGSFSALEATSSMAGTYNFKGLQEGEYTLTIGGPGWWKVEQSVHPTKQGAQATIAVRRLGGVEITFRSQGLPIPGCAVRLESLTPGDDLDGWVSEDRITVSVASGSDGVWKAEGLPAGQYRWSAEVAGEQRVGVVQVVGGLSLIDSDE